jgi:hypothetical protein
MAIYPIVFSSGYCFSIYEPAAKPEGSYARNHQYFDGRNQRGVYVSKHIVPLGLSSFKILCTVWIISIIFWCWQYIKRLYHLRL